MNENKVIIKNKFLELKRHINEKMVLMLCGNLFTIIINIAIVKILTNKFSTTDFGIYSLIVSFAIFPQLVLFAPIAASIFPFIKNKKENNKYEDFQKDLFDLFFLIVFILAFVLVILFSTDKFFQIATRELIHVFFLSFFFSSTLSWLAMLDTFSLANYKVKHYTVFPLINLVLKLISLISIYNVEFKPYDIVLIFSVLQLAFCCVEIFILKKHGTITSKIKINLRSIINLNTPTKKEILNYSKNFFIWGLFGWGQTFLDKWFLNQYVNTKTVGIYAVYFQYGFFPFTMFSSIISQYITPLYFSKIHSIQESLAFLKKLLFYCVYSLLAFCIIMFALAYYLAPFFIRLLTNDQYLEYINLFPVIVLAGCFYGFGQIITVPLLNSDFVSRVRYPKIGSAIIAVILFWVLVPHFGMAGIMYSLLISNVFYFLTLFIINWMYLKGLINTSINSEL